jgi:hypothetical protein
MNKGKFFKNSKGHHDQKVGTALRDVALHQWHNL